jgi:hypothetical protein
MTEITSGMTSMPKTDEEWHKLIQDVLDRRSNSYVQAAMLLAQRFVIDERDKRTLADSLTLVQERCTQLITHRRTLSVLIDGLAKASPEDRDRLIAEMLTASKAMQ